MHFSRDYMWITRTLAKPHYFTPVGGPPLIASNIADHHNFPQEQFSEEWDWVDTTPIAADPRPPTAGNYSWKTNLYQFALVSFQNVRFHKNIDE